MHLIVGLGNPGPQYEQTRHNIGFIAAEKLAKLTGAAEFKHKKKCEAYTAEVEYNGRKIVIALPQTYMNNSGIAVAALLNWHKIEKHKLIVVHDDVDLDVGQLRIRQGGSSGGHKGVESVIQSIGTSDFIRIRVGVGKSSTTSTKDYVLQKIPGEQKDIMNQITDKSANAALSILIDGLDRAMNKFNG